MQKFAHRQHDSMELMVPTKNFDVTLCHAEGRSSFYIGRERVTGRSITVRSTKGRFVNGAYAYQITPGKSEQCFLQVLHRKRVVLSERFISHMFMTDPCMPEMLNFIKNT